MSGPQSENIRRNVLNVTDVGDEACVFLHITLTDDGYFKKNCRNEIQNNVKGNLVMYRVVLNKISL